MNAQGTIQANTATVWAADPMVAPSHPEEYVTRSFKVVLDNTEDHFELTEECCAQLDKAWQDIEAGRVRTERR